MGFKVISNPNYVMIFLWPAALSVGHVGIFFRQQVLGKISYKCRQSIQISLSFPPRADSSSHEQWFMCRMPGSHLDGSQMKAWCHTWGVQGQFFFGIGKDGSQALTALSWL